MTNRWLEDAGERMQLQLVAVWAFLACTVFAVMLSYFLFRTQQLGWRGAAGILLLGWLVAGGVVYGVWTASGATARAMVQTLTAAGNLPPAPSYSLQEALIARGNFGGAVQAFQEHLAAHPDDLHARLALAALWGERLHDPARAELLLLETRRLHPPAEIEFAIGNALIDLYHAHDQLGREMAELARLAQRFAGTQAGSRARAALLRLKARES